MSDLKKQMIFLLEEIQEKECIDALNELFTFRITNPASILKACLIIGIKFGNGELMNE